MKHIESIQPEYAAEELERIVREEGDATASAALSRLLQQWTGCAIPPTADTPESEVEELVPLCLSILRRHWTTPLTALGDGTTPMSLADLMRRLILGRVDGNEALGIPPANANIPTALAALLARKIGGVPEAEDGMSLVNLIAQPSAVQTITDNNVYDCSKTDLVKTLASLFPNLSTLHLGFKTLTATIFNQGTLNVDTIIFDNMKTATTSPLFTIGNNGTDRLNMSSLQFPKAEKIGCLFCYSSNGWWTGAAPNLEELEFPALIEITSAGGGRGAFIEVHCTGLKTLDLSKVQSMGRPLYGGSCLEGLEELDLSSAYNINLCHGTYPANISTVLLLLKIKEGFANSLNLTYWIPTLTNDNLATFLSNFKTYIAQRLTDNGSGLTLTLSQAVRDAIQTDPEIVSIITSKGWTISPAPSV